ncbi:MAG: IS1595 family transposase [Rhodospirillaceae bacterium]
MTDLLNPVFTDADKAREALEAVRWPNGPVCPHCGCSEKIGKVQGKSHRPGLYYCGDCTGHFTVTVGTVFERSKIPLNKWWLACHLLGSSKKGMSAHQLHRMLGVTYKTAWFMAHRIREAMTPAKGSVGPIGGEGKTVEVDETYLTRSKKTRKPKGHIPHQRHAIQVVSLLERGGEVRSTIDHRTVRAAIAEHLEVGSRLVTDKAQAYIRLMPKADHASVDHSKGEYVRDDVHTNTLEGYFSILKRGLIGTYQHVDKKHLGRYLAEFDFRMNNRAALGVNDADRSKVLMKGIEGKRLTYRRTNRPEA